MANHRPLSQRRSPFGSAPAAAQSYHRAWRWHPLHGALQLLKSRHKHVDLSRLPKAEPREPDSPPRQPSNLHPYRQDNSCTRHQIRIRNFQQRVHHRRRRVPLHITCCRTYSMNFHMTDPVDTAPGLPANATVRTTPSTLSPNLPRELGLFLVLSASGCG